MNILDALRALFRRGRDAAAVPAPAVPAKAAPMPAGAGDMAEALLSDGVGAPSA